MMDCNQAEKSIIDFVYDELSSSDKKAFELHLEKCPVHAKEVDRLRATLVLVRKQPKADMPLEWSNRILAQAEMRTSRKPKPLRILFNPVAAFAIVTTLVLTVGIVAVRDFKPTKERILAREEAVLDHPVSAPEPVIMNEEKIEIKDKDDEKIDFKKDLAGSGQARVNKPRTRPKPAMRTTKRMRKMKPKAGVSAIKQKSSAFSRSETVDLVASQEREPKLKEYKSSESIATGYLDSRPMQPDSAAPPKSRPSAKGEGLSRSKRVVEGKDRSIDLFEKAEAYMSKKNPAQAVIWYGRFLEENPSDYRAVLGKYRLAKALFLSGRCGQAIFAIEEAVKISPNHPLAGQALLDQASCLVRKTRFHEAAELYRRIAKEYPDRKTDAEQGLGLIRSALSPESEVKSGNQP